MSDEVSFGTAMLWVFNPIVLFLLSASAVVVYKLFIRPGIVPAESNGNSNIKIREVSALFLAKSVLLVLAAYFTGSRIDSRPGQTAIKLKFFIAIFLLEMISSINKAVDAFAPEWTAVNRISLTNMVRTITLVMTTVFLVGSADNLGEKGIKAQFIILVVMFEALALFSSAWLDSSLIPNFVPF